MISLPFTRMEIVSSGSSLLSMNGAIASLRTAITSLFALFCPNTGTLSDFVVCAAGDATSVEVFSSNVTCACESAAAFPFFFLDIFGLTVCSIIFGAIVKYSRPNVFSISVWAGVVASPVFSVLSVILYSLLGFWCINYFVFFFSFFRHYFSPFLLIVHQCKLGDNVFAPCRCWYFPVLFKAFFKQKNEIFRKGFAGFRNNFGFIYLKFFERFAISSKRPAQRVILFSRSSDSFL